MNKLVGLALSLLVVLSVFGESSATPAQTQAPQFLHARPGYTWSFPRDHSYHQGFQTEWWYYTGHLWSIGSEPFRDRPLYGFQLTFFRRQGDPANPSSTEYLAHAALTDLRSGQTRFATRRGGALLGAAGASPETLEVWSGDWLAELVGETHVLRFSPGKGAQEAVRLLGTPKGQPWLQGQDGFSRKGACETCASHYYSIPRIPFSGEVRRENFLTPVVGLGWMDHEFMSNTLAPDQVGWDWMGLMLKDGRSLTVFRLRREDGGVSFVSASLLADGRSESLSGDQVMLTPSEYWTSPASKGRYPLSWRVEIPSKGIDISVHARVQMCEIGEGASAVEPRYWEGPVASKDESVLGYLEMTGYAGKVKI